MEFSYDEIVFIVVIEVARDHKSTYLCFITVEGHRYRQLKAPIGQQQQQQQQYSFMALVRVLGVHRGKKQVKCEIFNFSIIFSL